MGRYMSKAIQIKIRKEDIELAVKKAVDAKIREVFKKQNVDGQIAFEVEQAIIEVNLPEVNARLDALETLIKMLAKDKKVK